MERPDLRHGTQGEPGLMDDRAVLDGIIERSHQINRLESERAEWVAEMDRRNTYELDGARSTASWLRHYCGMAASQANAVIRVARAMGHMTVAAKRFAAGELDRRRMEKLATARHEHPDLFELDEAMLVDHALTLSHRNFAKLLAYWRHAADDRIEDQARLHHERRRLHLSPSWLGAVLGNLRLDPVDGAVVMTAISTKSDPWLKNRRDRRSPAQARADALVEICRDYLDHGEVPVAGGERPHAMVLVDLETLEMGKGTRSEMDRTGVITPETARRVLCDASVTRVITRGTSQVLDVGRATRTVSAAQRRALIVRDGGCAAVDCDVPHRWTDAHHRTHWSQGGKTDLPNLVLLCRFHHRQIHFGNPVELSEPPPRE